MKENISLEQSLQTYRVMNTPTELSWKQHWAHEVFTCDSYIDCPESEKIQFNKRLQEGEITLAPINLPGGQMGELCTLQTLVERLYDVRYKDTPKIKRSVVFSSRTGERPAGKTRAFELWNGFQVIDLDIKDAVMANKLKQHLFDHLKSCNWFLGVALSSSGKGLHVYTKITVPEADANDTRKRMVLYLANFRHKYSYVYIVLNNGCQLFGYAKEDVLKWMDLAMFKPQQGAFIGYDPHPLINTHYFEDFIYVNFDNDESIGSTMDWMTYPDLKEIFKRWEWFEDEDQEDIKVEVQSAADLEYDMKNKVHYKHGERWRLANTLVKLYGIDKGYRYLRMICSNSISDRELQADCITASRHDKPVDVWAVNRLNNQHGFKIKLNVQAEQFNESEIYRSVDSIDNPTVIRESDKLMTFNIKKNEYLGNIKWQLLDNIGRVTLIEAGAGVGKTEMVKSLVRDGKKVVLVMPFTSTIKSKVEGDKDWLYAYGNHKVRLDQTPGVAMTIDKFSHLNLMDIKACGFDYIIIDESHLMFQSEYRPVMTRVIEMIRNTEVPIILMSGTPSGELVFFPDIVHLKVNKEETRQKEFHVFFTQSNEDLKMYMCKAMAKDIAEGRRILFPTNKGTLFSKEIKAAVQYFLETDHFLFDEVSLQYYKKSNVGEKFMDDVNFQKTIKKTQILMCSSYLSVGVDILDKYKFAIYFDDLMMPQEVEQFANRLRSNDLFINLYVSRFDADGNSKNLNKFREINFKLNDEEIKNIHSILRICNSMIERNPVEYRYNTLISSIVNSNKFIEYNEIDNKYYLNEIAYKTIYFERKYREYVQQLPVLMKGMKSYGYLLSSTDLPSFESKETIGNVKTRSKIAYDDQVAKNTDDILELLDLITEDRLELYKDVMAGHYEIKKGTEWKEDTENKLMMVKNIEMFEKVIPIFVSMSKMYTVQDIKDIFMHCRKSKKGEFNFAAIGRIRMLINLVYNNKIKRLDLPIQEFMESVYKLAEYEKVHKSEISKFIRNFATRYAINASSMDIIITHSEITMKELVETFTNMFKCLVEVSRPDKEGNVKIKKIDLLWQERSEKERNEYVQEKIFVLAEFLQGANIRKDIVEDSSDDSESFNIG